VSDTSIPERDPAAISKFIERFAADLVEAGMPRMPARVFTAILASDSGRLTSAELAESLQISPAAVSGAIRYLTHARLVAREREPGSRRDHFVVWADDWYEMMMRRDQFLSSFISSLQDGVDALGARTPAGARVAETRSFFEFMHAEMPGMMEKWRKRRDELRGRPGPEDPPA
jgi:DNA-binding transcriptional regulator GbsR (MarR family)